MSKVLKVANIWLYGMECLWSEHCAGVMLAVIILQAGGRYHKAKLNSTKEQISHTVHLVVSPSTNV